MIVSCNRDVINRAGVLLIPATKGGTSMEAWIRITREAPAIRDIFAMAPRATDERARQDLRYRVRTLGLSAADTQVALGLLWDALGDEVAA